MEIAIECGLRYEKVFRTAKKEKLVPACMFGKLKYTQWQVDYLQEIFYYEGILTEITLESSMNFPETIGYNSREDFINNGNITPNNGLKQKTPSYDGA